MCPRICPVQNPDHPLTWTIQNIGHTSNPWFENKIDDLKNRNYVHMLILVELWKNKSPDITIFYVENITIMIFTSMVILTGCYFCFHLAIKSCKFNYIWCYTAWYGGSFTTMFDDMCYHHGMEKESKMPLHSIPCATLSSSMVQYWSHFKQNVTIDHTLYLTWSWLDLNIVTKLDFILSVLIYWQYDICLNWFSEQSRNSS